MRKTARFIRPAPWHEEFLAWLAAGLGPKAAAEEVGIHPTRAMQVRWTDATFRQRWISINRMKEDAEEAAVQERLAAIRERNAAELERRKQR